jgi:hypothetical protein
MPDFTTSSHMRAMIEGWEGLSLTAYRDPVNILTIGYGHTGPDVTEGQTITQEQADALLADDLGRFETGVNQAAAMRLQPKASSMPWSHCPTTLALAISRTQPCCANIARATMSMRQMRSGTRQAAKFCPAW